MTAPVLTGTGAAHVTGTGAGFAPHRGDERVPTCVEIAWGYDGLSTATGQGAWKDVTQYVLQLSTTRGRQQELQVFESGTISLRLDNRDGRFNPWNTAGAYGSGNVRIGCPIRIRISSEKSSPTGSSPSPAQYDPTDGGFYYAAYGFITNIAPDWSPGGVGGAWCDIQAADGFALLNRSDMVTWTFPEAIATTQSGNINDGVGFEFAEDRLIGMLDGSGVKSLLPGFYIAHETWSHFGDPAPFSPLLLSGTSHPISGNALSYLQGIADSGFIDFYVRPDNVLCWRPFNEIRNQAFDTTTIFGDNIPTEIPYADVGPTYDDQNLYNDVSITFTGPSTLTSTSPGSIATYGRRVLTKTFDTESFPAVARPDDYITRYSTPVVRIPSIAVSLRALTDAQRMRVLSLPIGYRVQVKRRPPAGDVLTAECYFEGISLTWDAAMIDVKAVLALAPVRPVNAYVDPIPS